MSPNRRLAPILASILIGWWQSVSTFSYLYFLHSRKLQPPISYWIFLWVLSQSMCSVRHLSGFCHCLFTLGAQSIPIFAVGPIPLLAALDILVESYSYILPSFTDPGMHLSIFVVKLSTVSAVLSLLPIFRICSTE